MSLVTTARFTVEPNARHSAATNAVFPLPTGPPIPIRYARPTSGAGAWWSCGTAVGSKFTGCTWSACKETHLFLVMTHMRLSEQVQARRTGRGQVSDGQGRHLGRMSGH